MFSDGIAVDLQDLHTGLFIGKSNLDLSVKTSGSEEGGVEGVGPVGGHEDLDVAPGVETIQLINQL